MENILLSTKLVTTNIGNQALSDELINLSNDLSTKEKKYKILGRPGGLDRYTIDHLDSNKLIEDFEKLAQEIYNSSKSLSPNKENFTVKDSDKTFLLDVEGAIVKTEKLRKVARKVRKFAYGFKQYSPQYKDRLKLYRKSDYYLYSAAGEISEEDFFYRQLLDLRVAQLIGVKVCAINQSIELPDGDYKELVRFVYSKMYKIVVRGEISSDFLKESGIEESKVLVAPDTAFLSNPKSNSPKIKSIRNIGINFTNKTYKSRHVNAFLKYLLEAGYNLTFISNDPYGDKDVALKLEEGLSIPYHLQSISYHDYIASMQKFDLIISSRLHTNELALTGGIPILPVEGNMHKTTEVLEAVDYPISVISANSNTYNKDLQKSFEKVNNSLNDIDEWFQHKLPEVKQLSQENLKFILE